MQLLGTKRATGYGYSLWEVQVYGTAGGTTSRRRGTCDTTNVAQGKTATASSVRAGRGHGGGPRGRRQRRHALGEHVRRQPVVAGGPRREPDRLQRHLSWEAAYGKAFRVQGSDQRAPRGPTLSTVTNGTGGTQSIAVSGTARYLRLDLQTAATGYGFSLWEVR